MDSWFSSSRKLISKGHFLIRWRLVVPSWKWTGIRTLVCRPPWGPLSFKSRHLRVRWFLKSYFWTCLDAFNSCSKFFSSLSSFATCFPLTSSTIASINFENPINFSQPIAQNSYSIARFWPQKCSLVPCWLTRAKNWASTNFTYCHWWTSTNRKFCVYS